MERDIGGEVSSQSRLEKLRDQLLFHNQARPDRSGPVVSNSFSLFQSWDHFSSASFCLPVKLVGVSLTPSTFGKGACEHFAAETRSFS